MNGNRNNCDELYKLYISGVLVTQDRKKHIDYLTCSAKNENSNAKFLLATYFKNGKYLPKNEHKAAYWFNSLAVSGDDEGAVEYSKYIFKFFKTDKKKSRNAISLLEVAANKNSEAAMILGYIYKQGLYGIGIDKSRAIRFFESAKDFGNEKAQYEIIELLSNN